MLFIKNAKILTMEGADFECASILVEGKKISAIGEGLAAPAGAQVIDAAGYLVTPGLIDAHTHLGLAGTALRWEGADYNEVSDPVTPHVRALDAINGFDESFYDSIKGGVTCVATSPGSANVICGQLAAMKTGGSKRADDLVIKEPLAIKCALGENPKNVHGQMQKKAPISRMGTAAIFRETFMKAQEYLEKKKNAEEGKKPDFNMKYEALIPVLEREIPIHIHAHQANDIHTAIRLIKEFNIRATIIHCTDAHLIIDDLVEAGLPTIIGPTLGFKSKPEVTHKTFATADALVKAGIKTCITTDHPVIPLQHLNVCAALCVQAGMDETEALKAITIYAAEVIGLEDRVGSLKVGKDADIVIWDKNPLDATSHALYTIIDGKIVYEQQ
ncbi:MAG: amidohydrolase [Defluviitaleaceae bacterium]|nr:amidohydrolase [Defluviitaleaceae bacterium]